MHDAFLLPSFGGVGGGFLFCFKSSNFLFHTHEVIDVVKSVCQAMFFVWIDPKTN